MHVTKLALLVVLCILSTTLIGCAGMQPSTSASNPPAGSSPSDSDPAEIHVTEYLYTADGHSISGFNINHDGTLSPLAGSPFAAKNGSFTLKAAQTTLVAGGHATYVVDPKTGAVSTGTTSFEIARGDVVVDPEGSTMYFVENIPLHFPPLEAWRISGATVTRTGVDHGSLPPGVSWPMQVDPNGNFLYVARGSAQDVTRPLFLAVYSRSQGAVVFSSLTTRGVCGSLTPINNVIPSAIFARGNQTFLYFTCSNTSTLEYTVIDNTTGAVLNSGTISNIGKISNIPGVPVGGGSADMTVDPSGSFLIMGNFSAGTVDVYSLDAVTGAPSSQPITRVAVKAPVSLTMDATGTFIYVVDLCSGGAFTTQCSENSQIFAYHFHKGELHPLHGSPYKDSIGSFSTALVKP